MFVYNVDVPPENEASGYILIHAEGMVFKAVRRPKAKQGRFDA
jgi:hypothetical protein